MCNAVPNRAQQQLVVQQPSTAASLTAKMLGAEFDGESMPISSAQERGHHCGRGGCCKLAFDVHSPSRWLQNAHDADACASRRTVSNGMRRVRGRAGRGRASRRGSAWRGGRAMRFLLSVGTNCYNDWFVQPEARPGRLLSRSESEAAAATDVATRAVTQAPKATPPCAPPGLSGSSSPTSLLVLNNLPLRP